ncbi:hypothetical protein SAMN05428989_2676 [Pseudoxanthomonas sp. GM95]|uniref:GIY-YIG nuclease family protein n=1 Tax=Pseudoxanthomonas sp. GM95 TaxID=1881043 RepID=UPI0008B228AE|nr:GIY-YIG nuclease family protein [Pseudoxanthomonas sp. GM95]SEL84860.1 hypothetical protein SAMN05428989_2676 [Pseudoxanthomonas sp. GM95]
MTTDDPPAVSLDGRYFTYVFPCAWEDFCKIGFSRDPLVRIGQLHPRWYEFFDLQAGMLVEADREREARDLELALRRPLRAHRAPAPMTIAVRAGGKTEWVRGANAALAEAVHALAAQGHRVHRLEDWLRAALLARSDRLHDWAEAQLTLDETDGLAGQTRVQQQLRDVLDGYRALGLDPQPFLSPRIARWYGRG